MAKPYVVNIVDGTGTAEILNGNYTVTTQSPGYDNSTIAPSSIVVDGEYTIFNFTVEAPGTLTFHVTEEGTSSGTPIVGATFIRCDKNGNTYGTVITTDSSGNAVFNNVPYKSDGTVNIYYKQTASDGDHEFDDTLQYINLTGSTKTEEKQNIRPALRTFNIVDANYENLPLETSQITLS